MSSTNWNRIESVTPKSFREDVIKADITIDNFIIKNLATFETKLAHLDLEALSLELELTLADLRVCENKIMRNGC